MITFCCNPQYQTKGIYWTFKNLFSFGPWISMRNFSPKGDLFEKFQVPGSGYEKSAFSTITS